MGKIFLDHKAKRIEVCDDRFYEVGESLYYPSVTTILSVYPKGQAFEMWLKDVSHNAKMIAERAANAGSRVHAACEKLMNGEELIWDESVHDLSEWQGILRFVNFVERFKPEFVAVEVTTISHKYKYAGTLDIVCKIDNKLWLIDLKFGNAVYKTYFMQLAAYRASWEENNPDHKIDEMGVLHLKAATRTEGKPPAIQGRGWQVVKPKDSYERLFEMFRKTQDIYNYENPDPRPKNLILPSVVKL